MRSTIAAAVIVAAMGTAAQADTIGSAPAHGGVGQTVAVCYYANHGPSSVNFASSVILQEPGVALAEVSESCGGALGGGGQRCRTVANITNAGAALWCRAIVNNKAAMRGRLEIRNGSGVVLTSQDAN